MNGLFNNKEYLKECLLNKKYKLLANFSKELFTEEFISEYGNEVLKVILWNIPDNLSNNIYLFRKCLEKKKYHLIGNFSNTLFTEEVITLYGDEILNNIKKVPFVLKNNVYLFRKCLEGGNYNLLLTFSKKIFTEDIINLCGEMILENIDKVPSILKDNVYLFRKCLEQEKYNLLLDFSNVLFTEDIIELYGAKILEALKGRVPANLKENKYLKELCFKRNELDLFLQFAVDENILKNDVELEKYAEMLEVDAKGLREKLEYLSKANDSVFETLNIKMLAKRMNGFDIKDIEIMALYDDVQNMILNSDDKFIEILSKMIECLDGEEYDKCPVIYKILVNRDKYRELINSIDINNLSRDMLDNLVNVLQFKENYYGIVKVEDLTLEGFNKLKNDKRNKNLSKIDNGFIDVEELRNDVLLDKFGIDIEMAKFICERYCTDMEGVNKSLISIKIKRILNSIYSIYNCLDIDKLKFFYLSSSKVRKDGFSFDLLETIIRTEYAKSYIATLYKVKEEHRLKKNVNVSDKVFYVLDKVNYNGDKPDIYILDGDFNMQIHALGAYLAWRRPDDFKERWENSKISYHGICTSYIGNNQMASVTNNHPVYGFAEYEPSALLLAGSNDIYSEDAIGQYATSLYQPYNLYDPVTMINKTRFKYNEMVLERRDNRKGSNFKRMPNYVVYFSDNLERIDNHIKDEVFEETVQASIDMNIPIVIVDRLKYALREQEKINKSIERFRESLDIDELKYIVTNYCNNMVGVSMDSECKVFTKEKLLLMLNELYSFIYRLSDDKRFELLKVFKELIVIERLDVDFSFEIGDTMNYIEELSIMSGKGRR